MKSIRLVRMRVDVRVACQGRRVGIIGSKTWKGRTLALKLHSHEGGKVAGTAIRLRDCEVVFRPEGRLSFRLKAEAPNAFSISLLWLSPSRRKDEQPAEG